jgi:hypothetical protein
MKINVIKYTEGMEIIPPMFVSGMPNEVYHSHHEGISSTGLKTMLRSSAHFKYKPARSPSRAMMIGTAIHAALLEPEYFKNSYIVLTSKVKDRKAAEYKQAVKDHGEELVLMSGEAAKVIGMQKAVLSNSLMADRLNGKGWRELSLFVRDFNTGVLVRVRFDLLLESGIIVDLKKTQDARQEAFSKSIDNYEYDLSAALYSDAMGWATGEQVPFEFAAVEEEMPHGCKLYRPCETTMQEGRRKYRLALDTFAQCEASGVWPSLPCDEPEIISLPGYRMAQIENEIIEDLV